MRLVLALEEDLRLSALVRGQGVECCDVQFKALGHSLENHRTSETAAELASASGCTT